MREATLSVGIRVRSSDECDPCVVGGGMKISECPNRQVVDDRTRTETSAVASKVATKAALEETNMLPGENDTFVIAAAVKNDSTVNVHC
jgi:hypothetical protein